MQTSRNPKVLDYALKYKLQPILDKVESLEKLSANYDQIIADQKAQEAALKEQANNEFSKYADNRNSLMEKINVSKSNLTSLINNNLVNPNQTTGSGSESGGETVEETNLITDKIVKCAAYGFVRDGVDYCMFGVTGKGLAIGTYPGQDLEYVWRNPENDEEPFASYYINDILFVDTNTAMISTNNGVIIYNFDTNSYMVYDTTCGLPSKEIYSITKVCNNDESVVGYLAATSAGIAYSPTGERWTTIDTSFSAKITCIATTNYIDTPQKIVFIGTTNGIYCINAAKLIDENIRSIKYLAGSSNALPNNYVYGLAYDIVNDKLAAATTGGAMVLNNASTFINGDVAISSNNVLILTNKNGLIGTSCYDAFYTVDNRLILGTANGLSITDNYAAFKSISRSSNELDTEGKTLNSHICNRIYRINKSKYTVIHGVGLTEDVEI